MNVFQYFQKQKPSIIPTTSTTILCQFIKNEPADSNIIFKSDNYLCKLMGKFNLMRNDKTLCDYEIRCNGHKCVFNAHKCVLTIVSDFFKVMLTGKF
jgi:hypothetical protein